MDKNIIMVDVQSFFLADILPSYEEDIEEDGIAYSYNDIKNEAQDYIEHVIDYLKEHKNSKLLLVLDRKLLKNRKTLESDLLTKQMIEHFSIDYESQKIEYGKKVNRLHELLIPDILIPYIMSMDYQIELKEFGYNRYGIEENSELHGKMNALYKRAGTFKNLKYILDINPLEEDIQTVLQHMGMMRYEFKDLNKRYKRFLNPDADTEMIGGGAGECYLEEIVSYLVATGESPIINENLIYGGTIEKMFSQYEAFHKGFNEIQSQIEFKKK